MKTLFRFARCSPQRATLIVFAVLGAVCVAHGADKLVAVAVTPPKSHEQAVQGLQLLQAEYEKQNQLVKAQQLKVDELQAVLGVADSDRANNAAVVEPARRLESMRIEAQADYERMNSLYVQLTNLTRVELKRAVLTASPDTVLTSLLQQQTTQEQKLAELSDSFGTQHPDVRGVRRVLEKISEQIDERLQGILQGLRTKANAEKARLETVKQEMDAAAKSEVETSIKRSPYFEAKRELDNLRFIRERLLTRLIQEKLDAVLPPSPETKN